MKFRVLGCSGSIGGEARTSSFLLDRDILLDAGTGVGDLSIDELRRIDHVFLSHSHLDHVTSLPLLLDTVAAERKTPVTVYAQAATLGVILPYSRTQESEADEIGLMLMAEAGYDPREAVKLWQNFEALGGERPPEFLSTHPAEGTRIERLQELMPEALERYEEQQ